MTSYPTNVSNSQWQIISKFLDVERNRKYELREIVNAILYLVKTGCQWRMLPADFPKWPLVYYYFSAWQKNGTWEYIHESLVEKIRRKKVKNELEIVKRDESHAFQILTKRWIVERTFSWIDTNRRNSKNYERLNQTSVAMVHLSSIRIMLNRF